MFIGSEFATLKTILSPPCFVKGILTIAVQRINTAESIAEWSDVAGKNQVSLMANLATTWSNNNSLHGIKSSVFIFSEHEL